MPGTSYWPVLGGSGSGVTIYANFAAFPVSAPVGTLAIDASTGTLYEYFAGSWQVLAQLGGAGTGFQATPVGLINNSNTVYTVPSAVTNAAAFILAKNGLIINNGLYTISGTTLTTTGFVPNFAETLYCFYLPGSAGGGGAGLITSASNTNSIDLSVVAGDLTATQNFQQQGNSTAPIAITAAGGIPFSGTGYMNKAYIVGSGGVVNITANPQVQLGTVDGQEITIQCNSANTVQINNGNGIISNGSVILGNTTKVITLTMDLQAGAWVRKQ